MVVHDSIQKKENRGQDNSYFSHSDLWPRGLDIYLVIHTENEEGTAQSSS
jgi:hypothetical protein